MKYIRVFVLLFVFVSCNPGSSVAEKDIISVTIAPFKYFVRGIAGDYIEVNIIVPSGSNPHNYEPYPEQITKLNSSKAFISNGFMGFERAWLTRLMEINSEMIRLSLGDKVDPLSGDHSHDNGHAQEYDPHYWVSPEMALTMAESVRELLADMYPDKKEEFNRNHSVLMTRIEELDRLADSLFSASAGRSFMIYHPNLGYLARDYGLNEIAVEFEGKEPSPSRFRQLIDIAREKNIKTIFIQREFDKRHAESIADEIDADIVVIDPLSEDWYEATKYIINALHKSFRDNHKTDQG